MASPLGFRGGLGAFLGALLLSALPALAQSTTYELTDSGEWVTKSAPEPGSDEWTLAETRRLLAEDQPYQARRLVNTWIKEHDRSDSPLLPEAYLLRGDALTAQGDEFKALYDYETVCKNYPGSEQFVIAVDREVAIALRYLGGLKRKVFGLRVASGEEVGIELLMRAQERLPGSRIAEKSCIELADYYYRKRELKLAGQMYDIFLTNYPQSPFRKKAMLRQIYANIARFKGPNYDASGLREASYLIEDFSEQYPAEAERAGLNDALQARLEESQAAQLLEQAKWYLGQGDKVSAKFVLRRLIARHPRTIAAERAIRLMKEKGWSDALEAPVPGWGPEGPSPEGPSLEPAPVEGPPAPEGSP